ncbi:peptidase C19, ubiquitin carboxyl-terminal hydrolase 2 [Calocera viscosa TUFC12733]|uniref:ubiquitinyl hydrolase 1 n=1 Tax=Calocera viscosa (strain TUFC12733) TaxID=1330018 RepID=A0A167HVW6_CALVF|nr:peptidase C19, ubiquitin carboxyl-terminal hydrolase 2 [Calocera viscosa TUFC12733]
MATKKETREEPLFPPGLVNTSNTCFFNSVMQCFIASTLLEATVESLSNATPDTIHPDKSPALTEAHAAPNPDRQAMPISMSYLAFLEQAWNSRDAGERRSLIPRAVLQQLGNKYEQYLDFRQQDAHELYCHLLDAMHMEEYDVIKKRQPPPPKPNKKAKRSAREVPQLRRNDSSGNIPPLPAPIPEEERLRPFVDQVFGGTLASMVVCETCKHVSHTFEDFTDLSLSIRSDEKLRKRDRIKNISQLFRLPARSARPLSLPPDHYSAEVLAGLERHGDDRNAESDVEPGPLNGHRPEVNGTGLLGGSAPDAKRMAKRLSIRWGKGRGKDRGAHGDDHDRSAAQSEVDGKTGDEREPDSDWEQVRKSVDVKRSTSLRPPGSGNATDEDGPSRESFPRRPNPLRLHSRTKGSTATITPPRRRINDEAAYIVRILADTAPAMLLPPGLPQHSQTSWLRLSGSGHGLVDCLRQFTAVEVLEGDNAFACRRCWKIAHAAGNKRKSEDRDDDEDDDDDDDEDAEDEMAVDNDNDLIVVSRPATPPSPPQEPFTNIHSPPMVRADSGELSLISVPSRPPSVISQSAISMADSEDDLAASVVSSPSSFPASHTRNDADTDKAPSKPTGLLPGGFRIPQVTTTPTSDEHSPSPTISDPSTPTPQTYLRNPFLFPTAPQTGRRPHRPSPLSDMDSGVTSDSDYVESEVDPSAPPSEAGSRPGSRPSTPPLPPPRLPSKPRIPRSQQVIHRRALKRYLISSAPPILVIHLKRFEQLTKSSTPFFGNLKKIEDFISFPEMLDMGPFMAPRREDYGLKSGRGRPPPPGRREDEPLMYRLYGVVVHIGSMLGGHYIAYTALPGSRMTSAEAKEKEKEQSKKSDRQWCYISDTTVKMVSFDEVLKAKAYLCFYERLYQ